MEASENTQTAGDELVITLFLAAMSRPATERAEFLAEVCSGNPGLLAEVERRVRWEEKMGGFLTGNNKPLWDVPVEIGSILLKRFRIIRIAGEGGMATVYEAYDEKLNRTVALKCPHFEFRQRTSPEILKALRVTHENVCRVFEIHTIDTGVGEMDFLTMEFIAGETLAQRLEHAEKAWLLTPEGESVARQICAGLAAVHDSGVIHRDLKPNNVMLERRENGQLRAVIMDFGIALGADMFSSQMRGTPSYLAPELWKGQAATERSDIYALGVLFYEMACGQKPFPPASGWRERLHQPPPKPDIREPFRGAIARCLAPAPESRPRSVAELEKLLWRNRHRRAWLRAAAAVAAVAASAWGVREVYWPASALRLAVLPARSHEPADHALLSGFLHDLSYRLASLRGVRRPLTVFSVAQSAGDRVTDAGLASRIFSATHTVLLETSPTGVTLILEDVSQRKPLRTWRQKVVPGQLAAALFAIDGQVVPETIDQLRLRTEVRRQPLSADAAANYWQGMYYARINYENAIQGVPYFERVQALAPLSALGYAGMAETLLGATYATGDMRHYGRAVTNVAKAEQLDPESSHTQVMLGRLNAFQGYNERALAHFRRAIELNPQEAQALSGMGYAFAYLGRYAEAETAFLNATRAQSAYWKPHVDAGLFYFEIGNLTEAERHWKIALQYFPGQQRTILNLGSLALANGRAAEAERIARECSSVQRSSTALSLLGDALAAQGRYAGARDAYAEATQLPPPDSRLWGPLGFMQSQLGNTQAARAAWSTGLQATLARVAANPREPERISWAAYYHARLGQQEEARARAAEALSIASPPLSRVRRLAILTLDLIGDQAAAARLLDGASPVLLSELVRGGELSASLRQAPAFRRSNPTQ
jgi:serine/threonine-protein kinase